MKYLIPALFYQYVTTASLNSAIRTEYGNPESAPLSFQQVLRNQYEIGLVLSDRATFYLSKVAVISDDLQGFLQIHQRPEELNLQLFKNLNNGTFEAALKFQSEIQSARFKEALKLQSKAAKQKKPTVTPK